MVVECEQQHLSDDASGAGGGLNVHDEEFRALAPAQQQQVAL